MPQRKAELRRTMGCAQQDEPAQAVAEQRGELLRDIATVGRGSRRGG
jgi:hypothetical protein